MAMDMFLYFDDASAIKGETKTRCTRRRRHRRPCVELGRQHSGSAQMGMARGSGKANFQDISFTKYVDLSSTKLMKCCATGKHIQRCEARGAQGRRHTDGISSHRVAGLPDFFVFDRRQRRGGSIDRERVPELCHREGRLQDQKEDGTEGTDKGNFSYDIPASATE